MTTATAADQKYQEDRMNQLLEAHSEEVEKKGAEFYNCGWAQGEDFVHSKTDKGRLFTELQADGKIIHEWTQA